MVFNALKLCRLRLTSATVHWWRGKITPLHDLSWYLKWSATAVILTSVAVRGLTDYRVVDALLTIVGSGLWFSVGFCWRDRALMFLNVVIVSLSIVSFFRLMFFV